MSLQEKVSRYVMQSYIIRRLKEESGMLRSEITADMADLYRGTGSTQVRAEVGGDKVGTVSARVTPPHLELQVIDRDAYREWCECNGLILTKTDDDGARQRFEETGEVPEGCSIVVVGGFNGITCRPDKKAIDGLLPSMMPGLKGLIGDE